jgi:hypothetical protein
MTGDPAILSRLEARTFQGLVQNNVLDCIEHKLDVLSVGGTSDVRIDLFSIGPFVERDELLRDESGCLVEVQSTLVLVKTDLEIDSLDLLAEDIGFVQEENDRDGFEPLAVANLVEELDGFVHAVNRLVFVELQVVLAHSNAEDNSSDALKALKH